MNPFQERVIAERKELYDKCEKLNEFIANSPTYKTLDIDEQVRLRMQLNVMLQYGTILAERIAEFYRAPKRVPTVFTYDEIDDLCAELGNPECCITEDGEQSYWQFHGTDLPVADTLAELFKAALKKGAGK